MLHSRSTVVLLIIFGCSVLGGLVHGEESAATWNKRAVDELVRAANKVNINYRAKNVILFLGDGMGISTVNAARILNGGESSLLSFERFPNVGLSKTYCTSTTVSDSAATATAYLCGVKTTRGVLGVDQMVTRGDCAAGLRPEVQLTSILDWSLAEGKSVGFVTTTRVTHATPGGTYANTVERKWEGDVDLSAEAERLGCRDIARQLIEENPDIQVIMGGGRKYFTKDERKDKRDLISEWESGQQSKGRRAKYVSNAEQLRQVNLATTDYLFGLFASSHMEYEASRNTTDEPSLVEMTQAAITILSRNPKGFFLLVEGGKIDKAHHKNMAYNALYETLAFNKAVEAAAAMTSEHETLTVATADHSHALVISGYQARGNGIFDMADHINDTDGKTFTTLLYGTGPGYRYQKKRVSVTNMESNAPDYKQEAAVPGRKAAHSGEDVGIYAKGPLSHLFHTVHEQNYIAHVMAYASCVGRYKAFDKCPPLGRHVYWPKWFGNH